MLVIVMRRVDDVESGMFAKFLKYFEELTRLCSGNFLLVSNIKALFHCTVITGEALNPGLCHICANTSTPFSLHPDRYQNKNDAFLL